MMICWRRNKRNEYKAGKRLYERLGYHAVGEIHLDGVYEYTDEAGDKGQYEDWCVDMIKRITDLS